MAFCRFWRLAVILVALGLAAPAVAQFDPSFNHLKCYQIKDSPVVKTIVVDTQFGRERIVKLTPVLLCAPAKKTCCANPATVAGCQVIPCPADPVPATAVPHFKCYKIGVKTCTDAAGTVVDCTTISKFAKNTIQMNLHDQFGDETVLLGAPKLLCAPVLKQIVGQTTTTATTQTTTSTTVSTTTTIPCRDISQPGTAPMCAGDCPTGTGLACVFVPSVGCTCELACALQGPVPQVCNNQFCPKAGQQCLTTALNPCGCCYSSGGGPCLTASDCCSGNCVATVCQ